MVVMGWQIKTKLTGFIKSQALELKPVGETGTGTIALCARRHTAPAHDARRTMPFDCYCGSDAPGRGENSHARPLCPSDASVARTEGCPFVARAEAPCVVQEPFSIFCCAVPEPRAGAIRNKPLWRRCASCCCSGTILPGRGASGRGQAPWKN